MAVLTALSTALTGKAAATLAGLTLAGGGLAVAVDATQSAEEASPAVEELGSQDDAQASDVELLVEENDTPEDGTENEGRAEDVHDALTDGEAEPGDEDFGQIVSDNAREGGRDFGQNVAETARDGAGEEESTEGRARADEDHGQSEEHAEAGQERASEQREQTPAADDAGDETPGAEAREAGPDNAERGQSGR
jgi:hypothetical protein